MTRRMGKRSTLMGIGLAAAALLAPCAPAAAQGATEPATPSEMVTTYQALADGILALKRTEEELVRSILAATYAHAQVELARARQAITSNDARAAQQSLEGLAASVAQLGTEGDASVAVVRKRLLDGGHHHNAAGEAQGLFDEGFVIVTRAAKQKFLESSRAIGQMARQPKAEALDAEWKKVEANYRAVTAPAK